MPVAFREIITCHALHQHNAALLAVLAQLEYLLLGITVAGEPCRDCSARRAIDVKRTPAIVLKQSLVEAKRIASNVPDISIENTAGIARPFDHFAGNATFAIERGDHGRIAFFLVM